MNRASPVPSAERRRAGGWYPWAFGLGFLLVAVVNGALIWLAVTSYSGLVVARPYERGLAYNEILALDRAQAARGWQAAIALRPSEDGAASGGGGPVTVAIELSDAQGRPLDGLRVHARLVRPTASGYDRETALAPLGEGRYAATLSLPLPGQWDVYLSAGRPGEPAWQTRHRLLLP